MCLCPFVDICYYYLKKLQWQLQFTFSTVIKGQDLLYFFIPQGSLGLENLIAALGQTTLRSL